VEALQRQWSEENCTYGNVPALRQQIADQVGQYFVVAESCGRIVGFAYGVVSRSSGLAVIHQGQQYLAVEDIYVVPACRSQGIGRQMLGQLIQVAESNGITGFLAYSATKNLAKVLDLYGGLGFKPWFVQLYR